MIKSDKSHWYYLTNNFTSSQGVHTSSDSFPFSHRIEGSNFELSLALYREKVTESIRATGAHNISLIHVESIFYIGYFEKMEKP